MPMIAERAGVASTSLYRRWGEVRTVLMEAAVAQLIRDHPMPNTGSLRGDLTAWAGAVAASLASPQGAALLRIQLGFAGAAPDSLRAVLPRLQQIEQMLEGGRARGEVTPDILQITDHLLGPLYMRALFGAPADEATAVSFVKDVLQLAEPCSS